MVDVPLGSNYASETDNDFQITVTNHLIVSAKND